MNQRYLELYEKADTGQKVDLCYLAWNDKDRATLMYMARRLRSELQVIIEDSEQDFDYRTRCLEYYKDMFRLTSWYSFEDYMIYLEMNRPPEQRFYMPRRKVMHRVCDALQRLYDGELSELFISCPPRVGKSTIVTFFTTWVMGINSERTNLYSSHSDTLVHAYYEGVREIITDSVTYNYSSIFPNTEIVVQNSKLNVLDLDRRKKYPTLTCRSISGTLNGSCDCNGLLIADDLCGGIEEVLNPDRMAKLWKTVDNNLLTRAKMSCKILWIGTRWSLIDPIGVRQELIENDPSYSDYKYEVINIPALDEDDHSNFDYEYGVGFDTSYYRKRRSSFERNNDNASWIAQYMGEPIEREGCLFDPDGMRYFNGVLPEEEPTGRRAVVDIAWGGGDYVAMPIAYEYADGSVYIVDVVFNAGDKKITQPLVASKLKQWQVGDCDFEKNNGGSGYQEDVQKELEKIEYSCVLTSHPAPPVKTKETRIYQESPEIREWYFLESGCRSPEYSQFMNNMFTFKVLGKNKHDDAPDSCAMLSNRLKGSRFSKLVVFSRPF